MSGQNHRLLQIALEIMNYIADNLEAVSFGELMEVFSLPKSTLHKLVQTLVRMKYLEKDNVSGKFSIGIRSFQTGNSFRMFHPFYQKAKGIVENVALACDETTHLATLEGTDVIYIYKFDSAQPIRIYSQVGKKVPAHTTAVGKAILSCYTDEKIRRIYGEDELPSMTPKSITSLDALLGQLRDVRRDSVAYEYEESTPQVKCIAVPIMGTKKNPIAGLSLALPVYREDVNRKMLIDLLLGAKDDLEKLYSLYE